MTEASESQVGKASNDNPNPPTSVEATSSGSESAVVGTGVLPVATRLQKALPLIKGILVALTTAVTLYYLVFPRLPPPTWTRGATISNVRVAELRRPLPDGREGVSIDFDMETRGITGKLALATLWVDSQTLQRVEPTPQLLAFVVISASEVRNSPFNLDVHYPLPSQRLESSNCLIVRVSAYLAPDGISVIGPGDFTDLELLDSADTEPFDPYGNDPGACKPIADPSPE
jgi:hypothetical protein